MEHHVGKRSRCVQRPEDSHSGGLQREGFEPLTVAAGRGRAIAADVQAVLRDFEDRLAAETAPRASHAAAAAAPTSGGFRIFRAVFIQRAFSTVLEPCKAEQPRDLFQFVCGTCWVVFLKATQLVDRVGVVFLVYLLYSVQHPNHFVVPVDVLVLEALAELREECEQKQAFLECPKILQGLAAEGALSAGIRATCRNVFPDRLGLLVERRSFQLPSDQSLELAASGAVAVKAQRMGVAQSGVAAAPILVAQQGQALDLSKVVEQAEAYAAGEAAPSTALREKVAGVGAAVARYEQQTPPEPRDLVLADGVQQAVAQAAKPVRSQKKRRRLVDSASSTDSGDLLLERVVGPLGIAAVGASRSAIERARRSACLAKLEDEGAGDGEKKCILNLRTKRARQGRLIGLDMVLKRGEASAAKLLTPRTRVVEGATEGAEPKPTPRENGSNQACGGQEAIPHAAATGIAAPQRRRLRPVPEAGSARAEGPSGKPSNHLDEQKSTYPYPGPWTDADGFDAGPRIEIPRFDGATAISMEEELVASGSDSSDSVSYDSADFAAFQELQQQQQEQSQQGSEVAAPAGATGGPSPQQEEADLLMALLATPAPSDDGEGEDDGEREEQMQGMATAHTGDAQPPLEEKQAEEEEEELETTPPPIGGFLDEETDQELEIEVPLQRPLEREA